MPYAIQSVLCRTSHFESRADAKKAVARYGFRTSISPDPNKGGIGTAYFRFRQKQPHEFKQSTFRTKKFKDGIDVIVGKLLH